jgi:hypothetical protein
MMDDARTPGAGRLALAVGAVAAGSAACLATLFLVGQPFGTINDIGNATTGVLSAALAWRLRSQLPDGTSKVTVGLALLGAAITVVGSILVVSGTTGFFLAGLVSSVGFAAIGTWLVALNRSALGVATTPRRLRTLGIAAGALMMLGFVALPGIPMRIDDMSTAPPWVWISSASWLGTYVALPAWAIWFGASESRLAARDRSIGTGTVVAE